MESQDKSTKTQDVMLEEPRNVNRNIDDEAYTRRQRLVSAVVRNPMALVMKLLVLMRSLMWIILVPIRAGRVYCIMVQSA